MQEQYLEVTISVAPTVRLFGLGERTQSAGAELRRDGVPLALWAADRGSLFADVNLYGSWPFLLQLSPGGAGGVRCLRHDFCRKCAANSGCKVLPASKLRHPLRAWALPACHVSCSHLMGVRPL